MALTIELEPACQLFTSKVITFQSDRLVRKTDTQPTDCSTWTTVWSVKTESFLFYIGHSCITHNIHLTLYEIDVYYIWQNFITLLGP